MFPRRLYSSMIKFQLAVTVAVGILFVWKIAVESEDSPLFEVQRNEDTRYTDSYPNSLLQSVLDDIPIEAGFQPENDVEFPTTEGLNARIPHICHQIWIVAGASKNETDKGLLSIPLKYVDNVKSFVKHNPDWTYFFWTNKTGHQLIADRYPHLLKYYMREKSTNGRSDILRYVLMYEYGGLYVDLDVINLRPLDIVTIKYPCILVLEPFEFAVLWNIPFKLGHSELFCRPNHPFFKQLMDTFPYMQKETSVLRRVGVNFFNYVYQVYSNISGNLFQIDTNQNTSAPYFYKGNISPDHEDGIYIRNTRFFMDSPPELIHDEIISKCRSPSSPLVQRMCKVIRRRGYFRDPTNHTFLAHSFDLSWGGGAHGDKVKKLIPLYRVVESFRTYHALEHH